MKNEKQAFTLAEIMITLMMLGVLAAILIPIAMNATPDTSRAMYKKAFATAQEAISQIETVEMPNCPFSDMPGYNPWTDFITSDKKCVGGWRCTNFEPSGGSWYCNEWKQDESCYEQNSVPLSRLPVESRSILDTDNHFTPLPNNACIAGRICLVNSEGNGCDGWFLPRSCRCARTNPEQPLLPYTTIGAFCNAFFDVANTIGRSTCGVAGTAANPNFTTADGIQWWGLGGTPFTMPSDPINGEIPSVTIYVDINGDRPPNSFTGDDADRFKIRISARGKVYTEPSTTPGTGDAIGSNWAKENEFLGQTTKLK